MARSATRAGGARGSNPALRMAAVRQYHSYIGAFIAPSVLFFALSGALQLFSLHEAHGGYHPPALFETMGSLHKDQRLGDGPKHKGPPHAGPKTGADQDDHDDMAPPKGQAARTYALKWMFLVVALGLIVSTCLGLWMALAYSRRKIVVWLLLILGAALPVLIMTL